MTTIRKGLPARETGEYLLTDLGLPVGVVPGLMHEAWQRGEARRGNVVVTVPSINSNGAEHAVYAIGIRLPKGRVRTFGNGIGGTRKW